MSSGYRYWLEIPEIVDLEVCSDISLTSRGKKTPFTNKKQVGLFPSRKQLAKEKHLQNSDFGRGELLVSGTSMPYIKICIIHLSLSFQGNPEGDLTWTSPDSGVKCSGFNSWWTVFPMAMGQRGTSWLKFTGVVLATWNILVIYIIYYIYICFLPSWKWKMGVLYLQKELPFNVQTVCHVPLSMTMGERVIFSVLFEIDWG